MDYKTIKKIVSEAVEQRLQPFPVSFIGLVKEPLTDMIAENAEDEIKNTDAGLMSYIGNILSRNIDVIEMPEGPVVGIFEGHPGIDTLMMSASIKG